VAKWRTPLRLDEDSSLDPELLFVVSVSCITSTGNMWRKDFRAETSLPTSSSEENSCKTFQVYVLLMFCQGNPVLPFFNYYQQLMIPRSAASTKFEISLRHLRFLDIENLHPPAVAI
jgi:hypothetical protein